ncbi:MAG: hypothetical protein KAY37_16220 [Phycisphaerae bacterium]|nr:hypothetical protein [Phycisphaerae bacterium]
MMSGRLHRVCLLGAIAVGVFAGPVLAGDGANQNDQVARLEALLEAQQQKLEALEQQVAATAQQDMNAARTEQMKQQIREVLSEQEFRESLMPSMLQAGYNKGFFIKSSDEKFMMKFNGVFQMRWTHYATRSRNHYLAPGFRRSDRTGFDMNRIRFRFSGHAYSKDLTYLLELAMGQAGAYDARVRYAWVNYRFIDEFQFKAGIFLVGATRAHANSIATMQFVEYPMMDAVFGIDRGTGVRFWGKLFDGKGEYRLDLLNSLGSHTTRTITNDEDLYANGHDNNPAIVFRTVWAILGGTCEHPEDAGELTEPCDMGFHTDPALNIGFHYAFNEDDHDGTLRIPFPRKTFFRKGGFGVTSSEGLQINQFGFDAGFKWQGFSAIAEYALRILDVRDAAHAPFTPLFMLTGDDSTNVQHGAYLQCGYFLPIPGLERKLELVGRVGGISALSSGQEGTWIYAGGLNYYIEGHKVKLQTDVTKISEVPLSSSTYSLANVNDDALIWRIQLQVAF